MAYTIALQRGRGAPIEEAEEFASQLGVSTLAARLAISRGAASIDDAERYFHPSETSLYDPFLLSGMESAVRAIRASAERGEKILVVGDYDCDGVCGAAILKKALRKIGADCSAYLPDRFRDGYGLNPRIIEDAAQSGTKLIVTADNGISALEASRTAKKLGIRLIVTDHHMPPDALPEAEAIVNPLLEGAAYPFPWLCGAGVALKLAFALTPFREDEKAELFALAAVATVADVVTLTGENRAIASIGISRLKEGASPGLKELAETSRGGLSAASASFISFQLAPRINASGRMASAMQALKLLESSGGEEARALAASLDALNKMRQEEEDILVARARALIQEEKPDDRDRVLFLLLEGAHEGIIGIAAGRLSEAYRRPVAIACPSGDRIKASVRSIPHINAFPLLKAAEPFYLSFGGHAQAAGFSIRREDFEKAAQAVNRAAEQAGLPLSSPRSVAYDLEGAVGQITKKTVRELEEMAPFGVGNPRPALLFENCLVMGAKPIGQSGEHARCELVEGGARLPAVGFGLQSSILSIPKGERCDIVASPSLNSFRGEEKAELEIKAVMRHIDCPDEYWFSLYRHFFRGMGEANAFEPVYASHLTVEAALDQRIKDNPLYILYGWDALVRCLRYLGSKEEEPALHFGALKSFERQANILVNPIADSLPLLDGQTAYVLDCPCFRGYEERLYKGVANVCFVKSSPWSPKADVTRHSVAIVYKCLNALPSLGGSAKSFVAFLNTRFQSKATLFSLLVSLDVMADLGFLSYALHGDSLTVDMANSPAQKSLEDSPIMLELRRTQIPYEVRG
ncbi:MAG: single-stranded-DNA-specific exonuclease RecJ [Eubacteriaceae bacterium]|jgi:single-stranded-DNA-specific exonuclease RecJ|nr:single-stranded-DNA-specific exonuclease RecJ [Eubacteriaceae bacterium]